MEKRAWLYDLLLIGVLIVAAYLRTSGLGWGEMQHQHPDESFLTSVTIDIQPVNSLSEYFDTAQSSLNPHNRGHGYYVYGTLPVFIVRYLAEGLNQLDQVKLLGRQVSGVADLISVALLYFIASRLYNRRVGLLSAAFSALAVMQIQQSHFYTTDLFANAFIYLAILFAVNIVVCESSLSSYPEEESQTIGGLGRRISALFRDPLFLHSLGFGFALGLAVASKLNAAPLAVLLPGAFIVRLLQSRDRHMGADDWSQLLAYLIAGALVALLTFRLFQPYAFLGIGLNPAWVANIKELAGQANGEADLPWNLQWARRSHLYSFTNLTVWGLGLPLGLLVWAGFLWMGWRILKGESRHLLLWGWIALYFVWQSMAFNATMRYQLPIYPLLVMMAGWGVINLWDTAMRSTRFRALLAATSIVIGSVVLVLTFGWAYAFTQIYTRPETRIAASRWIYQNIPGPINLGLQTPEDSTYNQPLPFPTGMLIGATTPYETSFTAQVDGRLSGVYLPHVLDTTGSTTQTLGLSLASSLAPTPEQVLARASVSDSFTPHSDPRGVPVHFEFDQPISLQKGQMYILRLETTGDEMTLSGSAVVNETDYDWSLPFRVDAYDGFGGLYRGDLNLQVYWDDNPEKLMRFSDVLNQADYIFIPTNHQYGQITRLPERYPLTTLYYRELLGCPANQDIIACYRTAKPGEAQGRLGFELVAVFESYPSLGPLIINDQPAEEAFTFYDHPKVMIFKKSADYNPARVMAILSTADLTGVVHLTPRQASKYKDLMLPTNRLAQQRSGGTWSELFDYDWIQNKYPAIGLVLWYVFIFVLGLVAYPITRLAFPGIRRSSYPVSRAVGLVLLAWIAWMGGSLGAPYTRLGIGAAFVLIAAAGLGLGWIRREELKAEWNSNRRFILLVELVFLTFFLIDLLIRLGNPDLWHPAKGGERPMDFSYFNAVLKSGSFPPYDPWFAGGYINYYYYGFVLVGTPVKLLGIVPSIAYNLILPTLFAMVALGAFTIGWNLVDSHEPGTPDKGIPLVDIRLVAGLGASLLTVFLGNLGTVQLIFQAFQRMAVPGGIVPVDATLLQRWLWAFQGMAMSFGGALLPIGRGDWYWFPSRVIPPGGGNEITEFPLFTFLYSDLHAHMIVLPLALLALAWTISFVKSRAHMSRLEWLVKFFIAGLVLGALYPTNLSDIYTYLLIAVAALAFTLWVHGNPPRLIGLPPAINRLLLIGVSVLTLTGLSFVLYEPYRSWYSQAYGALDPWHGPYTPFWSYITHWGLFLFIIIAWMAWETHEWMAATPLSSLAKLKPYQLLIETGLAVYLALVLYFILEGIAVGWLVLTLSAWAGVLLLRPGQTDMKRLVLFWIGTALVITLVVEVVTVRGDIGRMNTVFKFYLQSWVLFTVSAAAAFGWLLKDFPQWTARWRGIFQGGVSILLAGAFLFTLTATTDKISDRMTPSAPHTLDSMTYMNYSQHWDGQTMDLSEDYRAIRWMQDHVQGSPVIVEANCTEYRWCTRVTIYTGLPGVVGWNWHQRQQRALTPPNLITDRVTEIGIFYTTTDIDIARNFLTKYQVKYIIVGQIERNVYPSVDGTDGFAKFEQYNGLYWRSVYRDTHTVIYEVLP
jgi:YYY domain-containing protein